jgi:hypothetical protein
MFSVFQTISTQMNSNQKVHAMCRKRSFITKYIVAVAIALSLTACGGGGGGGGGGSSSDGTGKLSLNITDAPVLDEDIAEVWVRFTHVIIHSDGGDDTPQPVTDGTNDWIDVNLKDLTEGKTQLLGDFELPGGHYSWIRLVIDPNETKIVERTVVGEPDEVDDSEPDIIHASALLDCSSCDESHLKLHRSFDIPNDGGWVYFTIDFDLQKSLTLQLPQSDKRRPNYAYKLRPTLRILDTELASTFIWGSVTDPADPTDCKVYTYVTPEVGDPALIMDDICVDDPPAVICGAANNQRPLTTADVEPDTVNNDGTFDYRTSLLYPGFYTVALVCDPDDIDLDSDPLTYLHVQEVDASLDPPDGLGVEINFPPAP